VRITRNGITGRALLAGLSGGAATLGAGAVAVLIYVAGYSVETGGTFSSPGGDMDFTGFPSLMIAMPAGALALPVCGVIAFRRARVPGANDIVMPASFITLVLAGELIFGLPENVPLLPEPVAFAAAATLAAAFCFLAVAIGLDKRAPSRWRMAAGAALLALMAPFLIALAS
jgi:hypothetical protein